MSIFATPSPHHVGVSSASDRPGKTFDYPELQPATYPSASVFMPMLGSKRRKREDNKEPEKGRKRKQKREIEKETKNEAVEKIEPCCQKYIERFVQIAKGSYRRLWQYGRHTYDVYDCHRNRQSNPFQSPSEKEAELRSTTPESFAEYAEYADDEILTSTGFLGSEPFLPGLGETSKKRNRLVRYLQKLGTKIHRKCRKRHPDIRVGVPEHYGYQSLDCGPSPMARSTENYRSQRSAPSEPAYMRMGLAVFSLI